MHNTEWWRYVEERLAARDMTPADFERESGISRSRINHWRDKGMLPTPDLARKVAETFRDPVLRAYLAAGILEPEDLDHVVELPPDLGAIPTDVLIAEFRRRLKDVGNTVSIPTDEEIAAHPERYSEGRLTLGSEERARRGASGGTPAG
ncbi:helix-turn-helix domain-containing protein [Saccharothrix lopnurensis]|uniref:Helix-turn-helix domain-containing protein n=1 Tax=Saccharothrix lopnurensis TaxID=1670621 RepID=A0ABW1P7W8_9PSEU